MTTIKHILQKEVFLPNDERLVGLVNVTQAGKKKKSSKHSFLCAALSTSVEGTTQVNVYQVKKSDKGETYKKKINWPLKDLKVVDGKDAKKDTADFDLHFEKAFKWTASSSGERDAFISCLWKHAQRHLTHKPKFENVPEHLLEEIIRPVSQGQAPVEGASSVPELEEYQALSNQEEEDLETLMSKCSAAISNAENFAEQLSKQLSILDGANMHVIMGSEDQVFNLMRLLDDGIQQAEIIESKLDSYDQILQGVKEQMELMKDKDMLLSVRNANHQKLLEELENVVHQLDLDGKYIASLNKGDLSTPNGILDCTAAAQQLQRCRQATIHPALMKMSAVEEQMKKFNQLVQEFSKRLAHHLNNLFIHQGNEIGETLSRHSTELRLPPHHSSHRDLTPYTELMAWLKQSDRSSFRQLTKVYTGSLSKLYTKEIQDFLENSRMAAMGKGDKSRLNVSGMRLSGSSASLGAPLDNKRAGSIHSIDSAVQGMDADIAMRHLFDQVFDKVLSELEPVCLAEQDFCCKFFHLLSGVQPQSVQSEEVDESEDTGDIWMKQKPRITVQEYIVENLGEGLQSRIPTSQLRQINEELRGMMNELFPMLEEDLEAFITFGDKMDGFYSMYMLVRMSEHVTNTQDTGSFLSVTFASSLVKIKRNFDKFVQLQIRAIEENKVSKKAKCGIISFVHNFEDFANQAENIFRGSERHTDLDKAYQRLVRAIFDTINRIAAEHPKTPREVIMMENFHHMFSILSQLKITCLEADRKEARAKYVENLNAYTKERLGRPLEKLHTFVEGVKSKMAQGVKAEEVGFQLAFSKTELRKVIKDYTGKEVKKSLDHMYKKLEKHLSEEENLYQVVWLSMQNEFMKQYNTYTDLINLCYPDSNINLEFTVDNVLEFFSNIAQSH
ncbi:exocyst complex component 1-like isoform X2 [Mya arenaria]|uniref:exocyst complex component 1-like isoform X2 n=1 Tax=Mya arenaria TaxID=6604 RepID=UPI0022DEAF3B|nr:exocyst complex component 1-like isoform X2 [Mya arenaria]XP_052794750.1 exocyst complex component 1-like isoform X2 [Mya arenaria]